MDKIKNMLPGHHKDERANTGSATGHTAQPGYTDTTGTGYGAQAGSAGAAGTTGYGASQPGYEHGTVDHHEGQKKGGGLLSKLKPGGGNSSSSSSSSDEEREGARERNIFRRQKRGEREQRKAALAQGATGEPLSRPVPEEKKHGFF